MIFKFELIIQLIALPFLFYITGYLLYKATIKYDFKYLNTLESFFLHTVGSVLVSGWVGLTLAEIGYFSLFNLLLILLIFNALLMLKIRKSPMKLSKIRIPRIKTRLNNRSIAIFCILILAVVLFFRPFPWILGGRDPGVYVNTGVNIAKTGSIIIYDHLLASLDGETKLFYQLKTRPQVLKEIKYEGIQFPGFYITNKTTGEVTPQFFYLWPTWIAIFYSLFGLNYFLYVTPFFAVLSVLSLYFAGKRLFNENVGLIASLLLTLNFAQIWYARYLTSEILNQFLIFSGIFAFVLFYRLRSIYFGLIAALCFGESLLTRIDSFVLILPLLFVLIVAWLNQSLKTQELLSFIITFGALLAHAMYTAFFISAPYTFNILRLNYRSIYLIITTYDYYLVFIGVFISVMLLLYLLNTYKYSILRKITEKHVLISQYILSIIFVSVVIYFYFIKVFLNGEPSNLIKLSWYLSGWCGILLLTLGFLAIARKQNFETYFFLMIFLTYFVLYIPSAKISPDHPWWVRRYLPVVIPSIMLFIAYVIDMIKKSKISLNNVVAIILLVLFLIPQVVADSKLISHIEYNNAISQVEKLSDLLENNSITLYSRNYYTDKVSLPLYYIYGKEIRPVKVSGELFDGILKLVNLGKSIYLLDIVKFRDIINVKYNNSTSFELNWTTLHGIKWKEYLYYIYVPNNPRIERHKLYIFNLNSNLDKFLCFLGKNWYGIESWHNTSTRWISNNATALMYSPQENVSILSFKVLSFYKPRTLQIYLNDKLIYEQKIPTKFVKVNIPIKLKKGENIIRLYTPDGCQRPCDIPELKNRDSRCLSLAFQNISLVKINPVKFIDVGSRSARIYLSSGWSGDEKWDNTNITFVWAEGSKSVVLLPLQNKSGLNLTIKCLPFIYDKNITQEMNIYFNGHFVDRLALKPGWNKYTVAIPENFTKIGINLLEFRYKYAESPKDHGINNDTRKLAVAFDWIKIKYY